MAILGRVVPSNATNKTGVQKTLELDNFELYTMIPSLLAQSSNESSTQEFPCYKCDLPDQQGCGSSSSMSLSSSFPSFPPPLQKLRQTGSDIKLNAVQAKFTSLATLIIVLSIMVMVTIGIVLIIRRTNNYAT
jgi:hypothetical protein